MNYYLLLALCFISLKLSAQTPAKPQTKPIVLQNATIHLGNGQVLEKSSVRINEGLIEAVANTVSTEGAEIIDLTGQHIYPGLILPGTLIGLNEVSQIRATRDHSEVGEFNPSVRTLVAYNTDSDLITTTRSNGTLTLQAVPRGGLVAGTSSIMQLDGWNWEDAVLRADDGIHLNWVSMFTSGGFFSETPGQIKRNEAREEVLQEVSKFFKQAQAYTQSKPTVKNLKLEAMTGLFDGTKTLFINVDFSHEIVESVLFAQQHQVKKIVIVGANEAIDVADFLKQNQIPVILERIHRLPSRSEEAVWLPYQQPYLLQKAGVLVALGYDTTGDETMSARNLPFLAGTASAYGLSKEEALKLVTSNTAKILGIEDKVGTIEKGKHATIVVSKGDMLDMRTNQITYAYIQGRKVDLNNKQTDLYQKYQEKYQKK